MFFKWTLVEKKITLFSFFLFFFQKNKTKEEKKLLEEIILCQEIFAVLSQFFDFILF